MSARTLGPRCTDCRRQLFRDEQDLFCPAGHIGFLPLRECYPEDLAGIYYRPLRICGDCEKRVFTTGAHECAGGRIAPNRKQRPRAARQDSQSQLFEVMAS